MFGRKHRLFFDFAAAREVIELSPHPLLNAILYTLASSWRCLVMLMLQYIWPKFKILPLTDPEIFKIEKRGVKVRFLLKIKQKEYL